MGFQLKFGLPFALLGLPLAYMTVVAEESIAWLVAVGIYFLGSVLVQFHYMAIAYRTPATRIATRLLLCLGVAVFGAATYAVFVTGNVDRLFEVGREG